MRNGILGLGGESGAGRLRETGVTEGEEGEGEVGKSAVAPKEGQSLSAF